MTATLSMPRLSLIIVTYNSIAEVGACLRSPVQHPPSTDYEVVVVENGSTDYAWDVLDELDRLYGPEGTDPRDRGRVRIIRFGQALGYGGALRGGFGACTKELIF